MLVLIKGAGDIASGIALRLYRSGFSVVMTDILKPTAVRRTVCFGEAVRCGSAVVEDIGSVFIPSEGCSEEEISAGIFTALGEGKIPVLADPDCKVLGVLHPDALVDAILAKINLGTRITDAPIVIGVGPGFTAGEDCHAVVETKRGHYLGRVITGGSAAPNTGIPGDIGGYTTERLLRAPQEGIFRPVLSIADSVKAGDIAAYVGEEPVVCRIDGVLRGLLAEGTPVTKGMKCGDVDPRCEKAHCFCASDKALAVGGGVLEAICHFNGARQKKVPDDGVRLLEYLKTAAVNGRKGILATIISAEGSVPRREGAVMALLDNGERLGTIGGGAVEVMAERKAKELLLQGSFDGSLEETYELDPVGREPDPEAVKTGMICGGRIGVRFTPLTVPVLDTLIADAGGEEPKVWLVGAGHVGRALGRLLGMLEMRYSVVDDRPGAASKEYFPEAEETLCLPYEGLTKKIRILPRDQVVVMTYGHRGDLAAVSEILKIKPSYIGCIGSRKKAQAVREALAGQGFTNEEIASIHSPVGLKIGAETPAEIAVSIAAELISARRQEQ